MHVREGKREGRAEGEGGKRGGGGREEGMGGGVEGRGEGEEGKRGGEGGKRGGGGREEGRGREAHYTLQSKSDYPHQLVHPMHPLHPTSLTISLNLISKYPTHHSTLVPLQVAITHDPSIHQSHITIYKCTK